MPYKMLCSCKFINLQSQNIQFDLWFRALTIPRLGANVLGSKSSGGGIFKAFIQLEFLLKLEYARDRIADNLLKY